jgi:TolA-binding protein
MDESFAPPNLDNLLSTVDQDLDDTNFVLRNTQHDMPELLKRLDKSEARRQTVLTDSEDENEEDTLSTRSATLRETVGQREKEVFDLKNHLETAKTQRELILDAKKRKKSDPEEFQKSTKRLAAHDYTPATYQFNDFSGSGILERGPPPSARQRAIDQEYDEREQSIEKFRERNA